MRDDRLSLRKRFVFAGLIVVIGGLLLEASARVFLPDRLPEPTVPLCVGRFDPYLGWALKAGAHGLSRRTGRPVSYTINDKGLRDRPTPYEKPKGIFRIVLLGDSRTFGFGVPMEKHFSTLLEGYFKNVEVINMGVSGFGVDQELLFLRAEGFRYQPDLVIAYVAHYGGHRHMHTRRFGKNKPRFKRVGDKLVLENSPVSPDPESPVTKPGTGPASPSVRRAQHVDTGPSGVGLMRRIHRLLRKHSRVYEILRDGIVSWMEPEAMDPPKHLRLADRKNLEDESFRHELHALGEAIVQAMNDESDAHGAQFVLVTQIGLLHRAATRRGILSLDATRPMSNPGFPISDELLHINEAGNGVLAWIIADFLERRALIPPEHSRQLSAFSHQLSVVSYQIGHTPFLIASRGL